MQQERIENLIKERDGNRLANLKGANEGKCGRRNATMCNTGHPMQHYR